MQEENIPLVTAKPSLGQFPTKESWEIFLEKKKKKNHPVYETFYLLVLSKWLTFMPA